MKKVFLLTVVIFVVFGICAVAQNKAQPAKDSEGPVVTKLEWVVCDAIDDIYLWYGVCGLLENKTNNTYKAVKIECGIYDNKTNEKVSDVYAFTGTVNPGDKVRFDCTPLICGKVSQRGGVGYYAKVNDVKFIKK